METDSLPHLVAIALFFGGLATLTSVRSAAVRGHSFLLLRTLFPTWRFFEEVTEVPQLRYRIVTNGGDSAWHLIPVRPTRRWHHLLINPEGNIYLAHHSLMQLFEAELAVAPTQSVESLRSYQLLCNQIRAEFAPGAGSHFEFQILRVLQGSSISSGELLYQSPQLPVGATEEVHHGA